MKVAPLSEIKNALSRYVDHVRRGGRVRILVRGIPAADLVPVAAPAGKAESGWTEAEIADLERRGVIRRGSGKASKELDRPGPRVGGAAGTRALFAERREGS